MDISEDAMALLGLAHERCLRLMCSRLDMECDGLSVVARAGRGGGVVGAKMAKKQERLDLAFAVVRHFPWPWFKGFSRKVEQEFKQGPEWGGACEVD